MRRPRATPLIALGLATALTAAGCATARPGLWSDDPVADRQRLMKLNGAAWQDAQAKLKAGQVEAIVASAEAMALAATQITRLFPEGSLTDKSKAKPEVWQKWGEFETAAKNLGVQADKLAAAARTKNQATVEAVAKDFGRLACGACHTPFRVPPPRN